MAIALLPVKATRSLKGVTFFVSQAKLMHGRPSAFSIVASVE